MNFSLFNYSSLGIILVMSLIVLWEDIQTNKIRNVWILSALGLGSVLLVMTYMKGAIDLVYLAGVLLNTAFAFVTGFVIWRIGFWPAGDSKLFVAFSFLLPLQYYWKTYLYFFPSFVLLINSFVLFLTFLVIKSIFLLAKAFVLSFKNKTYSLKNMPARLRQCGEMLREVVRSPQKMNRFLVNLLVGLAISTLGYVLFSIISAKQNFHLGIFLVYYAVFL